MSLPADQAVWIGCRRCDIWYTWPFYKPKRCANCGGELEMTT